MENDPRIRDLKAELQNIAKSMTELEDLERLYPGRYHQRLSLAYSRYAVYQERLNARIEDLENAESQ